MYVVIADGSHQYRVSEGSVVDVEIKPELPEGATTLVFDRVLMVGDCVDGPKIGRPLVPGAKVTATVLERYRGDKLIIQKFRRRKKYALKKGHRQDYLRVKIDKIEV